MKFLSKRRAGADIHAQPADHLRSARPAVSKQMGSIWFPQLTHELAATANSRLGGESAACPPHPLIEDRCGVSQSEGLLKESPAMDHYLRFGR